MCSELVLSFFFAESCLGGEVSSFFDFADYIRFLVFLTFFMKVFSVERLCFRNFMSLCLRANDFLDFLVGDSIIK